MNLVRPCCRQRRRSRYHSALRISLLDAQRMSIADVADEALERAYHIVTHMLAGCPDVLAAMQKAGTRLIIIG